MGRSFSRTVRKHPIPVLPLAGAAIAISQPILYGMSTSGSSTDKMKQVMRGFSVNFLGFDSETHKFTTAGLIPGYAPPIIGMAGHKLFNWLGVNRHLRHFGFTL